MDLWLSCSLWVHGSRTSALMSVENPCNCGQHIHFLAIQIAITRPVAARALLRSSIFLHFSFSSGFACSLI